MRLQLKWMTDDVYLIRQTVRNMVRRRNQVRLCIVSESIVRRRGAGVFVAFSFSAISFYIHQAGISEPVFQ